MSIYPSTFTNAMSTKNLRDLSIVFGWTTIFSTSNWLKCNIIYLIRIQLDTCANAVDIMYLVFSLSYFTQDDLLCAPTTTATFHTGIMPSSTSAQTQCQAVMTHLIIFNGSIFLDAISISTVGHFVSQSGTIIKL